MARRRYRKAPQFAANGNLILSDDKPNIDFLLRVTSTPIIEQCLASTRQVCITGYINILAEYVASVVDGTQPVTFIFFKLPFEGAFTCRHARTGMYTRLRCDITSQQLQITNPREIALSLNVKVKKVKLARTPNSLQPHDCKPCLLNFFEAGNPQGIHMGTGVSPQNLQTHVDDLS